MIFKLILALAVAYSGWWLWKGPKKAWTTGKPGAGPARDDDGAALDILGLTSGASVDEIRAAHRRLLRTVHPDHGGSAELTRQVNAARDNLLGTRANSGD